MVKSTNMLVMALVAYLLGVGLVGCGSPAQPRTVPQAPGSTPATGSDKKSDETYARYLGEIDCKGDLESKPGSERHVAALRWLDKNVVKPGVSVSEVQELLDKAYCKTQQEENGVLAADIVIYRFPISHLMPVPAPSKGYDWYGIWVNTKTEKIIEAREVRLNW